MGVWATSIRPGLGRVRVIRVTDLRTLNKEERDALKTEAERRALKGQSPLEICRALGIKPRRYAAWAKRGGFRAGDLNANTSPGVGETQSDGDLDAMESARTVLAHVRHAIDAGDRTKADRLVAAWAAQRRRDKRLSTLEAEAAHELDIAKRESGLSDSELVAAVSALIGRQVSLRGPNDAKS